MSTFGYRKELKKYESVDEDEVLAGLSFEELQELERELEDMDPDDNVPIGLRQKDQTAKTPTGTFSREALLKYWEDETRKLLEDDSSPEHDRMEEGQTDKSEDECATESDSNSTESEDSDEEEERQNRREGSEDEAGEVENDSIEAENEEEKKDKCKQEPLPTSGRHGQNTVDNLSRNLGNCSERGDLRTTMTDQNLNVTPERPCGNPIVIDEALERILRNDPTMSELNFNNIEDISQETLLRISEALSANTHVRVFSLSNTRANDRVAFAVSKMLRENCSITNLNIESNFVSGRGILALMASLQQNSTLVELRFHNQRHICGGQVEMEMVHLLRDNNTLLKLGYQFDLPGPRMTATSILTRNQDRQRQRRLQQQREKGHPEAIIQPGTTGLSGSPPLNKPPWFSPRHARNDQTPNNIPPPPPPLTGLQSERNTPTRKIAEMIKQHEGSTKGQSGQKKPKSKRGKNGANMKCSSDILKELKNALKPSSRKKKDNPLRPPASLSSTRDDLMAAIRGSSIRSLKSVTLQPDLC
uniref:leiomodin-2-like n=1 Tax=Oncorhynchus gorbuscha TaxID=8017 RepID=UPI001EAE979C|nr:leiomodin-2-like [Oncorhynchus gorbuscha]